MPTKPAYYYPLEVYTTSQNINSTSPLDLSQLQLVARANFPVHLITDLEREDLRTNYASSYSINPVIVDAQGNPTTIGQHLFEILPFLSASLACPNGNSAGSPFFPNPATVMAQTFPACTYWTVNSIYGNFVLKNPANGRYCNCGSGVTSGTQWAVCYSQTGAVLASANQTEPSPFGGAPGSYAAIVCFTEDNDTYKFFSMGFVGFDSACKLYFTRMQAAGLSVHAAFFDGTPPDKVSTDPYAPGGTSETGGGDGDFDFTSTDIPIPPLPTIGAHDAGFLSLFAPSAAELRAMASYMWAGAFDPNNFKKLFANPMDAILGLHIVPRTATAPATSPASLVIGNISTGLTMPKCAEQYYELDCGTVQIPAKWGAYLDYSPYSKLSLYLPYVGFVEISPDDCMRGSIRVVYHVDILSGSCAVFVYCVSNRGADGHTLYTYTGACACDCPITEGQYTNAVMGILSIAASAASGLVAGATGNAAGAIASVGSVADAAISMAKPQISRSGSFGGSAGLMGIQYPFLVLTVPRMCTPKDQNIYLGYPSLITSQLGDVAGYAEVEVSHLAGMSCTEAEALEILDLLRRGVIF